MVENRSRKAEKTEMEQCFDDLSNLPALAQGKFSLNLSDGCLSTFFYFLFFFLSETSTNGDLMSGNLFWRIAVFTFHQSPNV